MWLLPLLWQEEDKRSSRKAFFLLCTLRKDQRRVLELLEDPSRSLVPAYSIREELVDPEEFGAQRPAALVPHSCRVEVVLKAERQMKMTSRQWPYALKSGRRVRFSVELADLEHDR